ncbi:MAG: hypothetical protein HUU54_14705 [Ignavibacteriaceae bacterium]|nr:hypothetical protein [Ignavibacteriaceae bacterium]
MKNIFALILLFLLSVSVHLQGQSTEDNTQKTKISAYFWSDYFYNVIRDNDHAQITSNRTLTGNKDNSGFQIRRMNLTFDHKLEKNISARLRFESENESFTQNGRSAAFIKDLYVEVKDAFAGQDVVLGLQANPMIELADRYWNNRHIEKTIGDYRGFFSSRDLGVSIAGDILEDGLLNYKFLFGNRSALRIEDNNSKSFQLTLNGTAAGSFSYMLNTEFVNYGNMLVNTGSAETEYANNQYSGFVLVDYTQKGFFSLTAEGIYSVRQNGASSAGVYSDRNTLAFSVHGKYHISPELNAALRYDYIDPNSSSDFKNDSRTGYIAVLNWKANKYITVSPNVLVEEYEELANGNKYRPSVTGRITFNVVLIP